MDLVSVFYALVFVAMVVGATLTIRKWYRSLEEQVKRERKGRI